MRREQPASPGEPGSAPELWEYVDPRHRRLELAGFRVEALDGAIGRVRQAAQARRSSYLVVERDSGARPVVVPAGLVEHVDSDARSVYLDRTAEEIARAPAADAERGPAPPERLRLERWYGPPSPRSFGVGTRKVARFPR